MDILGQAWPSHQGSQQLRKIRDMGNLRDQFSVRHVGRDDPDYHRAINMALDVGPLAPRRSRPLATDLIAAGTRRGCSLDLIFGAYRHDRLISACVALQSPGAAALVYASDPQECDLKACATQAVLETLRDAAWGRSIRLLEVLLEANASALERPLEGAGFRYLTQLLYLQRYSHQTDLPTRCEASLTWVSYTPQKAPLFCEALEASYVQSLDCPELTGLRTTADVLAGHRASGVFDPSLWWVAKRDNRPVGVLLLSRLPTRSGLEIVYVGVAQPARGTRVANALLSRAVDAMRETGVRCLTLAVDARNTPARRMYRRWGFEQTAGRHAWIASPTQVRT